MLLMVEGPIIRVYDAMVALLPGNRLDRGDEDVAGRAGLIPADAALIAAGCASSLRPLEAVPADRIAQAYLPGFPVVRYSLSDDPENLADTVFFEDYARAIHSAGTGDVSLLAVSGGGANGAYGAGLIAGWTEAGGRPEFRVVTGVSTGALIAPFAFLGPDYDDRLRKAYTTLSDADVFQRRNFFSILRGDSLLQTDPLHETLSSFVDQQVLAAVAAAHQTGRRLYVGTTDMDSQKPIAWDMGAIASSGHPDALELFRKVLVASASIPVAFPPQYFEVELSPGGPRYAEMHMDGGVTNQVFLHLEHLRPDDPDLRDGRIRAYVIRNAKLSPEYSAVPPRIMPILMRTLASLVKTQGVGDLYRIYGETQAVGADFFLASEPADLNPPHEHMFDPAAMTELFNAGLEAARAGYPWVTVPPGWDRTQRQPAE